MEDDHADVISEKSKNVDSIFTLFSNLTGEKNQNPKFCVELIKSLRGNNFKLGSGTNLDYSVKRVVRGLGSNRLHSQCGCFASLTCILKYQACSVEKVLEVLDKEQQTPEGVTKSESRALTVECVLACGAIINSGRFNDQPAEVQESILKKLIAGGTKKTYLSSVACKFLVEAVNSSDSFQFKHVIWPIIKSNYFVNFDEVSEDGFYLLYICLRKNFKTVNKYLQKSQSTCDSIEKQMVLYLLKNNIKYDHPIYESAALLFCSNSNLDINFWTSSINKTVSKGFHKSGVIITLFFHIIKNLSEAEAVPKLLVPKLVEILLKTLSFKSPKNCKNDDCYSTAKSALNSMVSLLCADNTSDVTRFETIKKLLFYPANMKFDMKTRTKCIYLLTSNLSLNSVEKLLDIYKQILSGEIKKIVDENGTEENWTIKEKQLALQTFTKTLNHPVLKKEINCKLDQIKFIFNIGFSKKSNLPPELQKSAKDCFFKAVMLQMPSLKDLVLLLDQLASHLNENIKSKNVKLSDDIVGLWNKTFSVILNLQKKSKNKLFVAVHVLLIYMGFHLFQDSELAKGSIEELLSCYEHLKEVHKKKENNLDETPHWTEVTVDLMLSLLSRENKLWRHVISCIFSQIVTHLTSTALQQIIDALDPKCENNVLNHVDSEESEDEDEDEDQDDSDSSASNIEESDSDNEDGGNKVSDQLRLAVRDALGYNAAAMTDEESLDMDQMNEEEEARLNERLSEAFRQFKISKSQGKKKKQTREEEAITHFKIRVLDLVEIYISSSPSMGGCLDLIIPLLDVLEASIKNSFQRPLQNKVDSVLKNLSGLRTFSDSNDIDQTVIKTVFENVIGKKEIPALVFVEMSPRISDCTTFLVRCSQQVAKSSSEIPLVSEYDSLLKAFFHSRDFKLPISVFQAILRIVWKGNFKIAETLFEFLAASNVRIFKKMKAIELLRIFYKNEKLHESADDKMKSELNEIEKNFIKNFNTQIADYENTGLKPGEKMYLSFFSNIIMLINIIQAFSKRHRSEIKKPAPWKKLILKLSEITIVNTNKKTRSQLANLAKTFKVSLPAVEATKRKRKNTDETDLVDNEVEEKQNADEKMPKKRRKPEKVKEAIKLKKESRRLREQMSSEGLEPFRFSAINAQSLLNSLDNSEP